MTDQAVKTEGLTKKYGDTTALKDLSFNVEKQEIYGLLGPNGAGKSTTIEILTGQIKPTSGTAEVLGTDPVKDPVGVREKIGILPEREDPPSFMTPREYLTFVSEIRNIPEIDEKIEEWGSRIGYLDRLDTLSMDLSRGQKQKVMLTQAFIHEPELVFIDEPLTNLDPIIQERVKEFIQDYNSKGNTVFLSTHDIAVAESICSRVGIIDKGHLAGEIDVKEVIDAGDDLIDEFIKEVGEVESIGLDD